MATAIHYALFCGICIAVLKELNVVVDEPYMVYSKAQILFYLKLTS